MYDRNAVSPIMREFLDYTATIKGRAANTVDSYYYDLIVFARFLKIKSGLTPQKTPFEEIKTDDLPDDLIKNVGLADILEFLHFLSGERGNGAKARARRAVTLRQFFKYLTNNKRWFETSPAQNLEMPGTRPPLPKYLTLEQAAKLLTACAENPENRENAGGWKNARDYCILTFFLNCGMRLSELVGLNAQDYKEETDSETGEPIRYIRVTGKGSKERIIYINAACHDAYQAYAEKRKLLCLENKSAGYEKAMFLSSRFTRITARRVQQIIDENLKICGLGGLGFSVHKLRHTAATLMYQNGVDVRVLKDVLGHENLGTTQIYTHVASEQMRNAVNNNPLADITRR